MAGNKGLDKAWDAADRLTLAINIARQKTGDSRNHACRRAIDYALECKRYLEQELFKLLHGDD